MKSWLKEYNCFEIAIESTSKYWIPIFNVLEDEIKVVLVHPKYTKSIKGKETDKKDSKWIANLFKCDLLRSSFIPPKEIREIRDLCRYRIKLISMRSSERNRYQNYMTVSNIGLASIVSDQRIKMKVISSHMDSLDKCIEEIEKEIIVRCIPYT